MARIKLTAGRIRDFQCPSESKQVFLWDTDAPGLGVRATAGAKVFVYQGKLDGKTIRVRIGDVDTWPIDRDPQDPQRANARAEARRLLQLINQGIDPRLEKRERIREQSAKRKEAARQEATLDEAWKVYIKANKHRWSARHLADHSRVAQKGGEKAKRGNRLTKPGPLAPLLSLKLSELTPERIKNWAGQEAAKRGTQTRIAFDALRAFIGWCADHHDYKGLAHPDACASRVKRQVIPKKRAKDDCLQKEQLRAWFAAVKQVHNTVISAYLQALLLTGARREELARLRWQDVDFRWQSMTIHDKVEGERTIPLTPYVAALLSPLARRNEWVFSSPAAKSGRLQEPRIQHNKALAVANVEGLTLHGLRRSFGTLSEWVEVPAGVVAQIQGHKPSATAEKHYRRRPLDLLRMWHTKIEAWILEQADIQQPKREQTHGLRVIK